SAMTMLAFRAVRSLALAAAVLAAPAAFAQEQSSPGLFGGLFDRGQGRNAATAQAGDSELIVRLDPLEDAPPPLARSVEQLQYRNQQLEQTVKRLQEDTEFRFQELGGKGSRGAAPGARPQAPGPGAPGAVPGRRSDAGEPGEGAVASAAPLGAPPAPI